MSETGHAPDAVVKQKRRLSTVWIIPIVAILIGAWLTWKSVTEKGPTFTISFRSAEGLEAGKTKIKYRDLELGVIERLVLSPDLTRVIATCRVAPQYGKYLTDKTRFWVVRARVSAGNVTGLSTLLSGAYVGIDPIERAPEQTEFIGLEEAPLITSDATGTRFLLKARALGSVEPGTPVLYHQMRVGEVSRVRMQPEGDGVDIYVFVRAPYDARIRTSTMWWNASGFSASINQNGLKIDTESFISMMIGGIAFDNPKGSTGVAAPPDSEFRLYRNKAQTEEPVYTIRERFLAYFEGSVKGLEKGSVVEFRGIQVGRVADVKLEYSPSDGEIHIPVVIEIEPERIGLRGKLLDLGPSPVEQASRLVERGLRARLESGNLLTGSLVVTLDFYPGAAPATLKTDGVYPEIPTLPKSLDQLQKNVQKLVEKLDQIPLGEIGREATLAVRALRGTLEATRATGERANKEVVPALTAAVDEVQTTLKTAQDTLKAAEKVVRSADRMLAPSSSANVELIRMLGEMTDTMRSVRLLVETLDRNPEALLMGREEPK